MRFKLRKFSLFAVILGCTVAIGLFALLKVDPVRFRTVVFQPAREVVYFVRELNALTNWDSIERVILPEPETVVIPATRETDIDIIAGVYRSHAPTPTPAVILLHGSSPWGRKAGLMRLLGTRLAQRGWWVIAPDARGFGDTEDPTNINDPDSWRTSGDLGRVIDYIAETGEVDLQTIIVVGHSLGANHALESGLDEPRVKGLVLIGPSRYPRGQDSIVPDWQRARFSADRRLRFPIPHNVAVFTNTLGNIRLLAESELTHEIHKPILLIDGEKEGNANLTYLSDIVSELSGPIEYHTLRETGHYCGARSFYGSPTVYYQPRMFEPFFELLTDFLRRQKLSAATANPDL